jgi:hypothetical protein
LIQIYKGEAGCSFTTVSFFHMEMEFLVDLSEGFLAGIAWGEEELSWTV